ncbi:MAG: family 78 glycoside hydrolase catalytic domain, partial [Rhodopirellula sp. JB053]
RFTYHGFRYVEVEGLTERPAEDFLAGVLVHTDVPRHGMFECSDALLNRIYQTSLWTIEDNIHSVIEDCPHCEKCAWLGDAHAVGETAIYNYDMALFWTKFVDDIETVLGRGGVTYWGQRATPGIPCNIAVGRRLCQEARPDWGAAYILLPWCLFNYYGDTDVFTRHYDHLARWISYVNGLSEEGIVVRGYGDGCPPGGNKTMECPPNLTSTAFFYGTVRIMGRFAEELGKTDDAEQYKRLAARVREAFNREFLDPETGGYGSQTADSVALRFGLASLDMAGQVGNSLRAGVVEQHQGHANVGIHGGRSLYTELCESGSEDVAFAAIRKETFPGYGYMLKKGFTLGQRFP